MELNKLEFRIETIEDHFAGNPVVGTPYFDGDDLQEIIRAYETPYLTRPEVNRPAVIDA